jgi:predicted alpha/beta hydrolase family esterase
MKVVILPGNGCTQILRSNWYGWLKNTLQEQNIQCIAENMPDPNQARRSIWIPFIHDKLKADEDTILVGHSSGAQAALRYAEQYRVRGIILVSSTYTDLGDAGERASGYYPQNETENLYDFEAMRINCAHWHQFHSDDDCFIPLDEAYRIRDGLKLDNSQFSLLPGRSHFFDYPFDEVVEAVKSML